MSTELGIALIAGAVSLASAGFTYRSNRATSRVEETKVDAAAFDRARAIYEGALSRMDGEIAHQAERLRSQGQELRTLRRQLLVLIRQVREAGLVPAVSEEDL